MGGGAGFRVGFDEDAAKGDFAGLGNFEAFGHLGEDCFQDDFFVVANDGIVGTGHACVGDVGGSFVKEAFVGGLHVGVGADNGGDLSIKVPTHGNFFRAGFSVEINKDQGGLLMNLLQGAADSSKGIIVVGTHKGSATGVDDANEGACFAFMNDPTMAGSSRGIVQGADNALFPVEEFVAAFLGKDVIASGKEIASCVKEFVCNFFRNAFSAGGVFAVGNDQINFELDAQVGEESFDRFAAGVAHDVANKQNIHRPKDREPLEGRKGKSLLEALGVEL